MDDIFDLDETGAAPVYNNTAALMPTFAWLDQLNPEQKLAVQTTEGPVLVLSGAGTGKTKVLTTRLAYILANMKANPWNCLVVTFTNRAAREMKERVQKMIGDVANSVWLGTFHSICVKILRNHAELVGLHSNFTILDTDDQKRVVKQICETMGVDDKKYPPQAIIDRIQRWKDKGLTVEKLQNEYKSNVLTEVYQRYQQRLLELNCVDFGDILLYALNILLSNADVLETYQNRFKYIMVDEYQDTNVTQYLFLRLLSQKSRNLCCVGDDDQSIYSWRGAEIENILRFEKDFSDCKTIRLERNYRSTANILAAASSLISHNEGRLGKTLKVAENSPAMNCDNTKIKVISVYSGEDEAKYVVEEIEAQKRRGNDYSQMAVLVRLSKPGNLKKSLLPKLSPIRLSAVPNSMNVPKFATLWLIFVLFCSHTMIWPLSALSTSRPGGSEPKPLKNFATRPAATAFRSIWRLKKWSTTAHSPAKPKPIWLT